MGWFGPQRSSMTTPSLSVRVEVENRVRLRLVRSGTVRFLGHHRPPLTLATPLGSLPVGLEVRP